MDVSQIYGRIKFVKNFPDFRVKIVKSFADLHVKKADVFPTAPGKWKTVNGSDFIDTENLVLPTALISTRAELLHRPSSLAIVTGSEALLALKSFHPLFAEGMGQYDQRDPRVVGETMQGAQQKGHFFTLLRG